MLRTGLAAILLVLLIPTVVAANTSFWALRTVLDSETFSTTVGRTLDTPALERLVATALADVIVDRVGRASPAGGQRARLAPRPGRRGADPDRMSGRRSASGSSTRWTIPASSRSGTRSSPLSTARSSARPRDGRGSSPCAARTSCSTRPGSWIASRPRPIRASRRSVANVPSGLAGPIVIAQVAELEPIQDALRAHGGPGTAPAAGRGDGRADRRRGGPPADARARHRRAGDHGRRGRVAPRPVARRPVHRERARCAGRSPADRRCLRRVPAARSSCRRRCSSSSGCSWRSSRGSSRGASDDAPPGGCSARADRPTVRRRRGGRATRRCARRSSRSPGRPRCTSSRGRTGRPSAAVRGSAS